MRFSRTEARTNGQVHLTTLAAHGDVACDRDCPVRIVARGCPNIFVDSHRRWVSTSTSRPPRVVSFLLKVALLRRECPPAPTLRLTCRTACSNSPTACPEFGGDACGTAHKRKAAPPREALAAISEQSVGGPPLPDSMPVSRNISRAVHGASSMLQRNFPRDRLGSRGLPPVDRRHRQP